MNKCVKHSKWYLTYIYTYIHTDTHTHTHIERGRSPSFIFKKYLSIFKYCDIAWQIIYLNETISLGKAGVLHKIKHLKSQLMPQPEKHKALKTYNLASVTDTFTFDGPIK